MITSTKKFNKVDYAISDSQAKQEAVNFLLSVDPKYNLQTPLQEQTEQFKKWDFTIFYDTKPITVETEQKRVWTTSDGTFPYGTIDVPSRKWESKADTYIMFNLSFDALAMTEMKNILDSEIITKSTRRSNGELLTKGETFFHVPLDKFKFYTKSTGIWKV